MKTINSIIRSNTAKTTAKIHHVSVIKSFCFCLLSVVIYSSWADEALTYKVNIIDRSNPDYIAINRTIVIDANFIGDSTEKQQLQISEVGIDEMELQAKLFIDGVKQGVDVIEENAKIQSPLIPLI